MFFNVVIIGAGSAGCVLANRLSETADYKVALLEVGDYATDPDIAIPQKWPELQGRIYDWAYRTTPQKHTASRVHDWPRGRIVGGSSCLHAMAHVRGHWGDYAAWEAVTGSPLWSYEGLLPYFKKSESFAGGASLNHGGDGPMPVVLPDEELNPLVRAYMKAAAQAGIAWRHDHNDGGLLGIAANSLTIRAGKRVSAADAYLTPILARKNLTVLTGARVHHLVPSGQRINRVTVETAGEISTLGADVIILCAGSIGSPLLLMRSGIGPEARLKQAGIVCHTHAPDVGANLHDHLLAGTLYQAKQQIPASRLQHSESLTYINTQTPGHADAPPDIVVACIAAPSASAYFQVPPMGCAYTLLSGVTHPTSRGDIIPTGPNLDDRPLINPNYLATEHDRTTAHRALHMAREIGEQSALSAWRAHELLPGPEADIDHFLHHAVMTHHHPVGTCRMGADDSSVVDARLKLRHFDNVFVVDASVIPTITSGPIHASVLAIAESFAARTHVLF